MSTFGRSILGNVGRSIQVIADGKPRAKQAGVTVDWNSVAAVSGSDVTLEDGVTVLVGEKHLRYGQVLTRIQTSNNAVQTVTIDATGGTFTLTFKGQTTSAIAYNAAAAAVQAALVALSTIGTGNVAVTGSAGGPYTVTFQSALAGTTEPAMTSDPALLTGGASTATVAVVNAGSAYGGKYGPYDPAAADGRQTLTKGSAFIVNRTTKENDLHSDQPPVIDGGLAFKDRILATAGTHSLAAGPTYTELDAVFLRLSYVADT